MRVVVFGSLDLTDRRAVYLILDHLSATRHFSVVIHGDYRGVDWLARDWARAREIRDEPYPAEWKRFRKSAGPIRNERMIREGKPEFAVEFPGGAGTADMRVRCAIAGIARCVVEVKLRRAPIPFVVKTEDWWRLVNVQSLAGAERIELPGADFGDPAVPSTRT